MSVIFWSLNMMYLGLIFWSHFLLGVLWVSCIVVWCVTLIGESQSSVFQIFSFFSSPSGIPIMHVLSFAYVTLNWWMFSYAFFSLFIFIFQFGDFCCHILKLRGYLLSHVQSTIETNKGILHFCCSVFGLKHFFLILV